MTYQPEVSKDPGGLPALERVPVAAQRMGLSPAQAYREIRSGRHPGPLVKLGVRASAVPVASTNKWIYDRLAKAAGQRR